jgi:hypothetical protein
MRLAAVKHDVTPSVGKPTGRVQTHHRITDSVGAQVEVNRLGD